MSDENKNQPVPPKEPSEPKDQQPAESGDSQASGTLPDMLDQFTHGQVDAETVAGSIRKEDPTRPAGDLTFAQKEKRAMEDDYSDYRGSWSEVVAAWIGGSLTDAQFNELREAFTPEGATTGEEDEAAEEDEDSESAEDAEDSDSER